MALWIQTPASPLISCVSLGRLFYLSGLVLTSICNGDTRIHTVAIIRENI